MADRVVRTTDRVGYADGVAPLSPLRAAQSSILLNELLSAAGAFRHCLHACGACHADAKHERLRRALAAFGR